MEIEKEDAIRAIRGRTAMWVTAGDMGSIPDQLLQASMCHPLAELSCGTASVVTVSIEGLTASVSDNGMGWPVHPAHNGRRFAELLLSEIYGCRDHKQHAKLARDLCRITLPVVVALSEVFTLDVYREGEHWSKTYRRGIPDAPLQVIGPSERSGTTLSFTLEESFCEGAALSVPAFKDWLATLDSSIPTKAVRVLEG